MAFHLKESTLSFLWQVYPTFLTHFILFNSPKKLHRQPHLQFLIWIKKGVKEIERILSGKGVKINRKRSKVPKKMLNRIWSIIFSRFSVTKKNQSMLLKRSSILCIRIQSKAKKYSISSIISSILWIRKEVESMSIDDYFSL